MDAPRVAVAVVTMGNRPDEVDALLRSVAKQDLAPARIVIVGNGCRLPEFAERQFLTLRCFACHRRDDRLDAWADVAAEAREFEAPKKVDDGEFAVVAPAEPVDGLQVVLHRLRRLVGHALPSRVRFGSTHPSCRQFPRSL